MEKLSILLIAMPWNRADYPSIQLGLLKSYLLARDIDVTCAYPYLDLEQSLGCELYYKIANNVHPVLSEGFWAQFLSDSCTDRFVEYCMSSGEFAESEISVAMVAISQFIDTLSSSYDWSNFKAVGFSCTFNQLYSSLVIAERIKTINPKIKIVFGGHEVSDGNEQGLLSSFPFVDCVISGPGEEALYQYLLTLPDHPVVINKGEYSICAPGIPDYDEYFARQLFSKDIILPLAASVGCDYGHCAFCTQHGNTAYSSLASLEIQTIIQSVTQKYGVSTVEFTDTSFPISVVESEWCLEADVSLFAQIRPINSTEVISKLSKAGFNGFQVGIETFNSRMASKMHKPNGLITNVFCLKLFHEQNIAATYNLILDFPTFTDDELVEMARVLPLLYHLQPPTNLLRFNLQLNSPVFLNPDRFHIKNLRPHKFYDAIPRNSNAPGLLPHYYDFDRCQLLDESLLINIDSLCRDWLHLFNPTHALLTWEETDSCITVLDTRFGNESLYTLCGTEAELFKECLTPTKTTKILSSELASASEINSTLSRLIDLNLILRDEDTLLSLPVRNDLYNLVKPTDIESYFFRG